MRIALYLLIDFFRKNLSDSYLLDMLRDMCKKMLAADPFSKDFLHSLSLPLIFKKSDIFLIALSVIFSVINQSHLSL